MVTTMPKPRSIEAFLSEQTPGEDEALERLLGEARSRFETRWRHIRRPQAALGVTASPLGPLLVALGPRGLLMIHYLAGRDARAPLAALRLKFDPVEDRAASERVGDEVRRYLAGEAGALRQPTDLALVESSFQHQALRQLGEVPRGAVITYAALAGSIAAPRSQRAVGNAMGSNPIPIYVPCHRVVRSDGSVGHYGGGAQSKARLLRAEGFRIGRASRLGPDAVWADRRSAIFCRPGCRAAARADRASLLIFANAQHARQAGLLACRLCRPA